MYNIVIENSRMKKLIPLLVFAFIISSCTLDKAAGIKINTADYETDISTAHTETVVLSGLKNTEFQKEINASIEKDVNGAVVSFDTMAYESTDNLRMGNRCVLNIKQLEKYNKKEFVSIIEEHYVYTGGAHGNTAWYPRNIDIRQGKIITLSELFNDDNYKEELNRQIDIILASDEEEYADLWVHPKLTSENDFYISDGKLVIFYPPYELSYYARGFAEFSIELTNIEGMLKEEYKRLLN